ncbi:MAG TPA: UPF0175 family protein [Rhizomicrobium sp.]|jgi:hypothetical protein
MNITVRIPDEVASRLGTAGELERRALEALALEEFKGGRLLRPDLRRLLGFTTRAQLDEFLAAHDLFGIYTTEDLAQDRRDLERLGY